MVYIGSPQTLCQCYVRDGRTGRLVYEETWPANTPTNQLVGTVAEKLLCNPYSIQLVLQSTKADNLVLTLCMKESLEQVGLNTEKGSRNNFLLQEFNDIDDQLKINHQSSIVLKINDGPSYDRCEEPHMTAEAESQSPQSSEEDTEVGVGKVLVSKAVKCKPRRKAKCEVSKSNMPFKSIDEFYKVSAQKDWMIEAPLAVAAPDYQLTPSTSVSPPTIGFVGLVNQAMTCYLNSLLQALYMTPEFRNALYKWQYEGSKPSKSIPFQLQKLFLNLQTSSRSAVETTELTLSFGWGTGDVWHQHDVQELCRVMFDALEQVFQNTSQANLINLLYQGKMIDYVKCLECGREKSREDTYLDIPLPVRPFGSAIAYTSVEEAMLAFVQPETLDGNNQYDCESCSKKVNAHKGLKFSTLPYLLTLHLKRFDFDYSTMHRIKLNDKVTFPMVLDLSRFVAKPGWTMGDETPMEEACVSTGRADDSSTADSALDDDSVPPAHEHSGQDCSQDITAEHTHDDDDEGIEMSGQGSVAASGSSSGSESDRLAEVPNSRDVLIEITIDHGVKSSDSVDGLSSSSHLYELYAIMIHSGSASGGHYYAYIKDFVSNQWFCFNDQSVTPVTSEDIEKTYGGGPSRGYYSGVYSSSTNAYMLMYRLIDKERNCLPMTPEDFPPHIKALVEKMKEDEEREKANRARQEQMVKVKVYWNSKGGSSSNVSKIFLYKDATLQQALHSAYQNLQLKDFIPEEQCRLVAYNHSIDHMAVSFEGREKDQIGVIMSQLRASGAPVEFLLESRSKEQSFLPYSVNDIRIPVCGISFEKEEVVSLETIQVSVNLDIGGVKSAIKKWLPHLMCGNDPTTTDICLILYEPFVGFRLLTDSSIPIKTFFLVPNNTNKLFVTPHTSLIDADLENNSTSSYFKFLNKIKNIVVLNLTLPDISEDSLEEHLIPPLSEQKVSSLNNNKSDGTMGDGPMNVVTTEEEALCCAATSDQSTSEDSSLTDSERTIIGEPAAENQSSSPSDSDHQMSSPCFESESFEPFSISQQCAMNSDVDWDSPQHGASEIQMAQAKSFYLKVSPYSQNNLRILKVVVDRNADWSWLRSALEPYIGVEVKYITLSGFDSTEVTLVTLSEQTNVTLKLHRPLRLGESKYRIFLFDPNSDQSLESIADWIVTKGQTIGEIKRGLLKYLERMNVPNVPAFNRCRLRRKNWKSVERPLADSETLDDATRCTDLFLEEVDGEPVPSAHNKLVLTKRYRPLSQTTEPFVQIAFNPLHPEHLENKLVEMSTIPQEHLKAAQAMNQFPWESDKCRISDYEWKSVPEIVNNYKRQDVSLVMLYLDDRESGRADRLLKEGGTDEVMVTRPTPSPRREKPLKIYLDNSSTPSSPSQLHFHYDL